MLIGYVNYASGQPFSIQKPMKIVISGDAMVHTPQLSAAKNNNGTYDFNSCFRFIKKIWENADYAVVNLETTISDNGIYSGYPLFASPKEYVEALRQAGIDVALLANNHIMDKGMHGVKSTLDCLDSLEIKTVGVNVHGRQQEPVLILKKRNLRVALLNYTYSANGNPVPKEVALNFIDTVKIKQDIHLALENADFVIVVYHFGLEYHTKASKWQRDLAKWTREIGADVVIGSHPHVVQDYDLQNYTVYSLGNLISNQQYENTDIGMSVELIFDKYSDKPSIRLIKHWCDKTNSNDKYRVLTIDDTLQVDNKELLKKKLLP